MPSDPPHRLSTQTVHADRRLGDAHGGVHFPIHPSTQFSFDRTDDLIAVFQGRRKSASYGRQGTPTTSALESKLASLDEGVGAITFATGMATISALFLTLLRAGDHLIISRHVFGNTLSLIETLEHLGIAVSRIDTREVGQVEATLRPTTRMVFVEAVANPGTQIPDLESIGALLRDRGILYVVDNTILSPALFRAASVGADLIIHSLSKSMAGHGQAMGGVLIDTGRFDWTAYPNISASYRSVDPAQQGLTQVRKKGLRDMGARLSSQEAHAISVGLETLSLRMRQVSDSALAIARFLSTHPAVARVAYPMLESHPQHERARRLFRGGSWLIAVELRDASRSIAIIDRLHCFLKATGLGDARSLVIPMAQTIFWEAGPDKRREYDIADGLIRLSIGLEDTDDLIADLAAALA